MSNHNTVDSQPILTLVCGLPGAGKSTLSRQLIESRPGVFLCPDQHMADAGIDLKDSESRSAIEAQLFDRACLLLAQGENVIMELPLWKKKERKQLRKTAQGLGARIELYFLDPPLKELRTRLKQRNKIAGGAIGHISKKELYAWAAQVEAPKQKELEKYDNF